MWTLPIDHVLQYSQANAFQDAADYAAARPEVIVKQVLPVPLATAVPSIMMPPAVGVVASHHITEIAAPGSHIIQGELFVAVHIPAQCCQISGVRLGQVI